MQTKITNTSVLTLYSLDGTFWYYLQRDINREQSKTIQVAEGKLILAQALHREDALIGVLPNGFQYFNPKEYVDSYPQPCRWLKPIIISETEKIEVSSWVVNHIAPFHNPYQVKDEAQLALINNANKMSTDEGKPRGIDKVLGLPEQFSPQQLQEIVEGRLKDGDKALVECRETCDVKRGSCDCSEQDIDCQCKSMKIQFNSSNHITLHKVEENKRYTFKQLEESFQAGAMWCATEGKVYQQSPNFKEWFEQNVE